MKSTGACDRSLSTAACAVCSCCFPPIAVNRWLMAAVLRPSAGDCNWHQQQQHSSHLYRNLTFCSRLSCCSSISAEPLPPPRLCCSCAAVATGDTGATRRIGIHGSAASHDWTHGARADTLHQFPSCGGSKRTDVRGVRCMQSKFVAAILQFCDR
jgi:hypothetical protein